MSMVDTGHTDVETLVSTKPFGWVVHPPTYLPASPLSRFAWGFVERATRGNTQGGGVTKKKRKKVEEQGIDPCASCMLSTRSTI
jgi:hypothetical protein